MNSTADSAAPSVEVRNLTKSFGRIAALSDVSLTVARSEFVSLLGPSGCGKTTLLRLVAGLETATSGGIWIGGKDVTRTPPYARDIGLVFQSYALFPHRTVAANLNFGLRHRTGLSASERGRAIEQALDLVRLGGYSERRPSQLSGGQQQRVALARAIVTRPEVLLLDEPLSNLDAKLRDEMRIELRELQRRLGITFIYVTHDRSEALSMSDRVAIVRAGRIEQVGTPREIFENPTSASVADFIGHGNLLPALVVGWRADAVEVRLKNDLVVRAAAPQSLRGQERVRLLVRRNAVTFHASAAEAVAQGSSAVRGRVGAVLYQGLYREAGITLESGDVIRVELPSHLYADLEEGSDVFIGIPVGGTWLLADEPEGEK